MSYDLEKGNLKRVAKIGYTTSVSRHVYDFWGPANHEERL